MQLASLRDTSDLDHRVPPSFVEGQAATQVLLNGELQMSRHLLVEVFISGLLAKKRRQASQQPTNRIDHPASSTFWPNTRPITSDSRSQR
jgi:hypothetical protein